MRDLRFFRKLYGLNTSESGALTLEAAVCLPIFASIILCVAMFVRVIYIENSVQNSLNRVATEISGYSYIYYKSGLEAKNNAVSDQLTELEGTSAEHIGALADMYDVIGGIGGNGYPNGMEAYRGIVSGVNDVGRVLKEIKNDPKKEFVSIAALIANGEFENKKAEIGILISKYFMSKNLKLGDSPLVYVKVPQNGDEVDGFKFDTTGFQTTIFKDKENIDIKVSYAIRFFLPVNILPEINVRQRATVRGFTGRNDAVSDSKTGSYWDLPYFKRGRVITESELKNVKESDREAYDVITIDPGLSSYKSFNTLKNTLMVPLRSLNKRKVPINKQKTLIIVVPEGGLTDNMMKAANAVRVEGLKKNPPIAVTVKEGYGKPILK